MVYLSATSGVLGKAFMTVKTFVDTNILLYAYDRDAGEKHQKARKAVGELWENNSGVLSAQVLEEFYVNVTRKIPKPLTKKRGLKLISHYLSWDTVSIHGRMVAEAAQLEERAKISFWDALIVVSAQRSGARLLLTEDFQAGRKFGELVVKNPF
jgi:predicted nucleic acid-binding protein